jgi:hypothetical protein
MKDHRTDLSSWVKVSVALQVVTATCSNEIEVPNNKHITVQNVPISSVSLGFILSMI